MLCSSSEGRVINMPNSIFTKILDDTIHKFMADFCSMPKELFYDEKDNLFHPGEYGSYREEVVRCLFRNIIYEDLSISDGFLINSEDKHSTQCDIIVYDKKRTPILTESNKIFVPVETCVGIGEIKSTLSKSEFKKALRKLSNNKKLKESASGSTVRRSKKGDFDAAENSCDQLYSFLICKNLDFNINKIDFDEIYDGIEHRNRHNLILSVEDGLFLYEFNFNLMSESRRKVYEKQRVNLQRESYTSCPNFLNVVCPDFLYVVDSTNELQHIREFISELHSGIHSATILDVDIRKYYQHVPKDTFI